MTIAIRPYQDTDADAFFALNKAWIEAHWVLEPKDIEYLQTPRASILDKGGEILMAHLGDEAVGCAGLVYMRPDCYELSKMAVHADHRGLGIGKMLIEGAIAEAKRRIATQLYVESNTKLETAVQLYRKFGWKEIPLNPDSPYDRVNICMMRDLVA